jgi:YD repeat-containing protein
MTTYVYDSNGNLVSKTEARGITTAYSNDALNRLRTKSYSDGTPTATYSYDTGVANGIGRLTQVANANSTTNYSAYDELGRVKQSNQQTTGQTYGFTYTYNRGGAVTSETYPSGRTVSTGYDRVNRPSGLTGVLTGQTKNYVSNASYWPHGALNAFLYGNNIAPGYLYNSRLQMSQMVAALGAGSNQYLTVGNYDWGTANNNGNLHSEAMLNWNSAPYVALNSFTQTFTYDGVNRLSHASDTGGWSRDFNYDRYCNMWVTNATGIAAAGATAQGNYELGSNRMYGFAYDLTGISSRRTEIR